MYLLLTDILSCPRCGPEFGLILLADHIEERRVIEGTLGCAQCRGKYPIRVRVADLRALDATAFEASARAAPAGAESRAGGEVEAGRTADAWRTDASDADAAFRLAALLGVAEGPGFLVIAGPAAALAGRIADLIEHIEVVAAQDEPAPASARPGVSTVAVRGRLPFYSARIRGVALTGPAADRLLEEGARVIGPGGRLVLEPAPRDAEARVVQAGLRILAQRDHTLVAARV